MTKNTFKKWNQQPPHFVTLSAGFKSDFNKIFFFICYVCQIFFKILVCHNRCTVSNFRIMTSESKSAISKTLRKPLLKLLLSTNHNSINMIFFKMRARARVYTWSKSGTTFSRV